MISKHFMRALICLAAPATSLAESIVQSPDSLGVELNGITVTAQSKISRVDGISLIPPSEKVLTSSGGIDLLQKLQLPQLSVNQLTGAVSLSGGGTVKLFINGMEASSAEVAAIRPEEILRIKYIDHPDINYPDANAAVDFILSRKESGGSAGMSAFTGIGSGKWAGFGDINAAYHNGPDSWTLNVGGFGMYRNNWVRDYTETWHYPTHSVTRREEGLPVEIGSYSFQSRLGYSRVKPGKYTLNMLAGFDYGHIPNKEEGDRHAILYASDRDDIAKIREHTSERSITPSLRILLKFPTGTGQNVTIRGLARHSSSRNFHSYSESHDSDTHLITSLAKGSQWEWNADASYDVRLGFTTLTAGARHEQTITHNKYTGSILALADINRHSTWLFSQADASLGLGSLRGSIAAKHLSISQSGTGFNSWAPEVSIGALYRPHPSLSLRYSADLTRVAPPLTALSHVEQAVQPGLIRRGNPDVKDFARLSQQFNTSFNHKIIGVDLTARWRSDFHPVMSETLYDGSDFIITYANQRRFSLLQLQATVTLRPWADHLTLSAGPWLNRYFSRGNTYSHTRSIMRIALGLDFNWGHWSISASTMQGGAFGMEGEEIISERDMNSIMAGYTTPRWSVMIGAFNLFMNDYWMRTENLSKLIPSTSRAHCNRNTYAALRFSLNLDFGHPAPRQPEASPAPDAPADTGILNGLK